MWALLLLAHPDLSWQWITVITVWTGKKKKKSSPIAQASSWGPSYSSSILYRWAVTGEGRWMTIICSIASPAGSHFLMMVCNQQQKRFVLIFFLLKILDGCETVFLYCSGTTHYRIWRQNIPTIKGWRFEVGGRSVTKWNWTFCQPSRIIQKVGNRKRNKVEKCLRGDTTVQNQLFS